MKIILLISIVASLIFVDQVLVYGEAATEGCVTAACHKGMLKSKNIHPVAEPCDGCHQAVTPTHPQKSKKTFKLTEAVPGLCFQCHPQMSGVKEFHSQCTNCHNPHDSAEPKLLNQAVKDLCTSCHPDKIDYKFVHGPTATGDCTACHNPHEPKTPRLLVKSEPDLCFQCHVDIQEEFKKKFTHPAMANGCTACHNPHGSAVKRFFNQEGAGLCFQCHPQIGDQLKSAKSIHAPLKSDRGCPTCHSPHSSDMPKLLPKTGKDFCLDCHKELIKKTQTVLHSPIQKGGCTPCHDPHGTPNNRLLIKPFSNEFYVSYSDKEYQLCFSCHNRDLLKYPTTSFATGFRDGERNLHYLHVNRKERGRSCPVCHALHAGENPKLITEKVPFGKWSLPLKFAKTDTGGRCAPGCHQPYSYDRTGKSKEQTPSKMRQ